MTDVARLAGVSQTAASFVLSGRGAEMRISAEAQSRVLQAARETGYRPNKLSRSLRTGTSQTIGFVSDTVATTPYAGHIIWGALDAARERDSLLFIAETEGDAELEQELIDALHDRGVDGIVLASMYTRKVDVPASLAGSRAVLLNALPSTPSKTPCVVPDELEAGRTVAQTFLKAGHRDGICLVGAAPPDQAPEGSLAALQRLQGIVETLQEAGAEILGAIPCTDWQPEHGYQATLKLLDRAKPSGLICFNDRLAFGAYQAISERRLRVPSDVSVISFDDDQVASWLRPQLTTVALPHYELGREAVNALLDMASAPPADTAPRLIPMELRERESVGPPGE